MSRVDGEIDKTPFSIGALHVVPKRNRLVRDGVEHALEPRVMDVFCVLAENGEQVTSRRDLTDRIWRVEFGADEGLTRAVSVLRRVIRDTGDNDVYVETIPKRGYRLTRPVVRSVDPSEGQAIETESAAPPSAETAANAKTATTHRRLLVVALVVAAVSATVATWQVLRDHQVDDRPDLTGHTTRKSVAVLPFVALSDDSGDDYFGKGVAEELLNALARFPNLNVAARASAFTFGGETEDIRTTATRLGVANVITGSVRRSLDRIRVSVQLFRADGSSLWANTYEASTADLFAVEDEVVRDIARALQVRLGVGAGAARAPREGVDPIAFEQYLSGLKLWGDRMRMDGHRERALMAFQRAVAFDPGFADAWAAIGVVGAYSAGSPLSRNREAFRTRTEDAFARALRLDGDNLLAHAGLAVWRVTQSVDVAAARRHLRRAFELAPNAAPTHLASAWYHHALGDGEAALAAYDRAVALDPLNTVLRRVRAEHLVMIGHTDEGFEFLDACQAERCLGEGFVAFASAAAVFSGDPRRMEEWRPILDAFEARIAGIPASRKPHVARIMPAFFSIRLHRDDAEAQRQRVQTLLERERITDTIGIWGPTLASHLPQELVIDLLHLAYERGDLFSTTFAFSALYGVNPYPDWLLQHPRYHELWARPGMKALAAAWRRAGRTAGLPKPTK